MEMIAVLAILGVLSSVGLPYARKSMQREKELILRSTLRDVRNAIDRFHDDWVTAQGGGKFGKVASPDGYPVSLEVLVQGVEASGPAGGRRRYLRTLPKNPFAPAAPFKDQWLIVSYQDDPKSSARRGKDVYDIRANTQITAMDGTNYGDW